jgi:hypothetical protein
MQSSDRSEFPVTNPFLGINLRWNGRSDLGQCIDRPIVQIPRQRPSRHEPIPNSRH